MCFEKSRRCIPHVSFQILFFCDDDEVSGVQTPIYWPLLKLQHLSRNQSVVLTTRTHHPTKRTHKKPSLFKKLHRSPFVFKDIEENKLVKTLCLHPFFKSFVGSPHRRPWQEFVRPKNAGIFFLPLTPGPQSPQEIIALIRQFSPVDNWGMKQFEI